MVVCIVASLVAIPHLLGDVMLLLLFQELQLLGVVLLLLLLVTGEVVEGFGEAGGRGVRSRAAHGLLLHLELVVFNVLRHPPLLLYGVVARLVLVVVRPRRHEGRRWGGRHGSVPIVHPGVVDLPTQGRRARGRHSRREHAEIRRRSGLVQGANAHQATKAPAAQSSPEAGTSAESLPPNGVHRPTPKV